MKRERKGLWCVEHESLNQPCDTHLLEVEVVGQAAECRVVDATIIFNDHLSPSPSIKEENNA